MARYLPPFLIALLLTGLIALATVTPQEAIYPQQHVAAKMLVLSLGGVFLVAEWLVDLSPLLLVIVLVVVFGLLVGIHRLVVQRRWPTLISVVVLVLANFVFLGAPGFLARGNLNERVEDCEQFLTPDMGIRIVRYPIVRGLDTYEQQFFLITHDGGENWSQLLESYARAPLNQACDNLDFNGQNGVIQLDSFDGRRYTYTYYDTTDGGLTWQKRTE